MAGIVAAIVGRLSVRIASAVMQAVALVLVARIEGPASLGIFLLGISVGIVTGSIVGLGSTTRALRILREPDPEFLARSLTLLRVASAILTSAGVVVALAVLGASISLAVASGLVAGADHFCDFAQICRAGLLQHRESAKVLVLQRLLPLLLTAAAAITSHSTAVGYSIGSLMCATLVAGQMLRSLPPGKPTSSALRGAGSYWVASIGQTLQQLDMAIVRGTVGSAGAGIYGASARVVGPLGLVINSAVMVVTPTLGQTSDAGVRRSQFLRFTSWSAVFGVGLAVASYPIALLVVTVLGPGYGQATPVVTGIVCATGLGAVGQALQSYLYIEGHARQAATITVVSVACGLAVLAIAGTCLGIHWLWLGLLANYAILVVLLAAHVFLPSGRYSRRQLRSHG